MKSIRNKWLILTWIIAGFVFIFWVWQPYQAYNLPIDTLISDKTIRVNETEDMISFTPVHSNKDVFIFFPGALIDPLAYSVLIKSVATAGYKSIIIKMPNRISKRGYQKIKYFFNLKDTTQRYILGGHGEGGKMASQFVAENPNCISGLILIGTIYPKTDLSNLQIPVMKICASNDRIATIEKINKNKSKLPLTTDFVEIKGGNHVQFGYYGTPFGDGKATISREVQHQKTTELIVGFLNKLEKHGSE